MEDETDDKSVDESYDDILDADISENNGSEEKYSTPQMCARQPDQMVYLQKCYKKTLKKQLNTRLHHT